MNEKVVKKQKKDIKVYSIGLRPTEQRLLADLKNMDMGVTEIFREALRSYHRRLLPVYAKTVISERTPEQKCADIGGIVKEVNGVKVCEYKVGEAIATTTLENLQ